MGWNDIFCIIHYQVNVNSRFFGTIEELSRKMIFLFVIFAISLTFGLSGSDPTDTVEDVAFIKIGDYSKEIENTK